MHTDVGSPAIAEPSAPPEHEIVETVAALPTRTPKEVIDEAFSLVELGKKSEHDGDWKKAFESYMNGAQEFMTVISMLSNGDPRGELIMSELNLILEAAEKMKSLAFKTAQGVSQMQSQLGTRDRVALEVMATEKSYVTQLKVLVEVYLMPMRAAADRLGCISEINTIFAGLESIYKLNEQLLSDISSCVSSWNPSSSTLGDIFVKFAPFLKVYRQFIGTFEIASMTIHKLSVKNKKFAQFLEKCEEDERTRGFNIQSLLITPIQRIPRYLLLLRELLKHTNETHPDKGLLEEALTKMETVAQDINTHTGKLEGLAKIWTVKESLRPRQDSLMDGSRRFIRQGPLVRVHSRGYARQYEFFLFNDVLVYGIDLGDYEGGRGHKYKYSGTLHLFECFRMEEGTKFGHWSFRVMCMEKVIVLVASSEEEMQEWMEDIKTCCIETSSKREMNQRFSVRLEGLPATQPLDAPLTARAMTDSINVFARRSLNIAGDSLRFLQGKS